MRTSADTCWCSRFCATAGAGARAPPSSQKTSTKGSAFFTSLFFTILFFTSLFFTGVLFMRASFRRDHEVRAPVPRPRAFLVTRIERKFLAVADDPHPIGGDAQRDEVRLDGHRAPLAERQVVL